jgi:hypothetical protein
MKHILNDISQDEKNSILEKYDGELKVSVDKFAKLVNNKLGEVKPLVEMMDVSSDSDYYKARQRDVTIPFEDLSTLGSLSKHFCDSRGNKRYGESNEPDCDKVYELFSKYGLYN